MDQEEEYQYEPLWGNPIITKGVDGNITQYEYDPFGRPIKTISPDGISTFYSLQWLANGESITDDNGSPVPGVLYFGEVNSEGVPSRKTWFDAFGRAVKTETDGFNSKVYSVKLYNNKGLIARYNPSFMPGLSTVSTSFKYDDFGRITESETGNIRPSFFEYPPIGGGIYEENVTDPVMRISKRRTDASGNLEEAEDATQGIVKYFYYSHGGVKEIISNV